MGGAKGVKMTTTTPTTKTLTPGAMIRVMIYGKMRTARVLSEAPAADRDGLADWIAAGRPDLATECAGCLADL